jgi:mono/diheme cytochrome c family protein
VLALAAPAAAFSASTDVPEQVTFAEHVAPIFYEHCVTCHRPNDVAPMSLLTYDAARPWARSIRRAVESREMPPWDADPRYGRFANDISLDEREIATVLRWVEQDAPAGDLSKMPEVPKLPPAGSWHMGSEPDATIELAGIDVPAAGEDLFVTQVYGMEIPAGKWVQAIELLPGNTEVLHHVVTYLGPFGMSDDEPIEGNAGTNSVIYLNEAAKRPVGMAEAPAIGGVWVAGSPPTVFPQGMGHPLSTKQLISLNMHYHPSGNAGTDRSKLGIYYGEGEMIKEITTAFAADPGIWIPAGAGDHREEASYLFMQDSEILSLLPHMHQRGKAMRYTLAYPDGRQEIILDVPRYDYDWQNIYRFAEPAVAPAGTRLLVEARWDNSADNVANPDPKLDIGWGDGTNFEMLVGFVDFVVVEGVKPAGVRNGDRMDKLLALHDPDHAYAIEIEGMGFGGPWGMVLPAEGDGTFYIGLGSLMFSTSVPGIDRIGDEVLYNGALITSGGGTRQPISFLARPAADGTISGEVFFGRALSRDNLETLRGKGQGFTGTSVAASAAATESAGL